MAEDPQQGPADDQPEENKPEPYRLGGSGGAKGSGDTPGSGGEPGNPLEALFASLAGGDMNALAAQLRARSPCWAAPARCSPAVWPTPVPGSTGM